jgi:phytanoyl-CoA hydroxylase
MSSAKGQGGALVEKPTLLDETRAFVESDYLALYPGIDEAIQSGNFASAWDHYLKHGRSEGRLICRFDEAFYRRSYPLAGSDLRANRIETALDHYILLGRGRGYLPHAAAPRPVGAADGLWIDAPDAVDRVHGRYETGQITAQQAERLEAFAREGFTVFRAGVSDETLDHALADLDRAYDGEIPGLKFRCRALGDGLSPWRPEVREHAAKVLDLHYLSRPVRQLIFAPAISDFLSLIFEGKALVSQSLGFFRGSGQEAHRDTWFVPYSRAMNFAASWIALEDVTEGGGELFYYPGSHRLPEVHFDTEFKSVGETLRINGTNAIEDQIQEHIARLNKDAGTFGLQRRRLLAKRGDVLMWHADLGHGGEPTSARFTRKSIVTHYCPRHLVPDYCERQETTFHCHEGHILTSRLYTGPLRGE